MSGTTSGLSLRIRTCELGLAATAADDDHFGSLVADTAQAETGFATVMTDANFGEMYGPKQPADTPEIMKDLQERYPLTFAPGFDYTNPAAYMPEWPQNT